MSALGTILDRAGVSQLGILDAQVDVPILTGAQRQGDLLVFPRPTAVAASTPIPVPGVTVVAAETSSGNTHSLHSWDGSRSFWDPAPQGRGSTTLGTLTVPEGGSAYLVHSEEHGANAMGPGTYVITRQREQADEIRVVAD